MVKERKGTCETVFVPADGGPAEDCTRENTVHIVHSNKRGRRIKLPGGAWVMPPKEEEEVIA
ncbi:hypothetical protein [Nonomuraea typhae]|uniref:NUDIX hydrolase n=1 Tax=Nonomuraea typhae TaxID=2603600 RepID=A0ABW7YMU5_9ACTN